MRERMKNLTVALLLVSAFLAASIPARAEGPRKGERDPGPGTAWMIRVLDWLGLPTLGAVWEASSAYIDPDGQPTLHRGGETGASASSDSSANIDPNG